MSSRVNKIASKEKNRGKRYAPFFVGHCPVRFLDVQLKQSFPSLKRIPEYYRLILLAKCDTGEMFNMDETSREQRGQSWGQCCGTNIPAGSITNSFPHCTPWYMRLGTEMVWVARRCCKRFQARKIYEDGRTLTPFTASLLYGENSLKKTKKQIPITWIRPSRTFLVSYRTCPFSLLASMDYPQKNSVDCGVFVCMVGEYSKWWIIVIALAEQSLLRNHRRKISPRA